MTSQEPARVDAYAAPEAGARLTDVDVHLLDGGRIASNSPENQVAPWLEIGAA